MTEAPGTVTLQEAADRLGVHYMTVYRYVRLGVLPAEKVGGTWRVDVDDLDRVRHPSARPAHGRGRGRFAPAPWATRFENRLRAGDELGAWGVVEAALTSGARPVDVYLEVIGPAMRSIGDAWEAGELDVGLEHRASVIVTRLLGRMGPRFARRGRARGTVLLGAPPGELHGIPVTMLADIVRCAGFAAVDLGADVPTSSFVLAARSSGPLAAAVVTVTTSSNDEAVCDLTSALHDAIPGLPVLVGGRAVPGEAASATLGSDGWAPDAPGAVALLDG